MAQEDIKAQCANNGRYYQFRNMTEKPHNNTVDVLENGEKPKGYNDIYSSLFVTRLPLFN